MCSWQLVIVGGTNMSGQYKHCSALECTKYYRPGRKGCCGRQYVLAEYVRYAKELLKDGAAEGDWICVTCRNAIRLRAATFGVAVGDDAQVPVCAMLLQCNSNELNGGVHHIGVGGRTTSQEERTATPGIWGSRRCMCNCSATAMRDLKATRARVIGTVWRCRSGLMVTTTVMIVIIRLILATRRTNRRRPTSQWRVAVTNRYARMFEAKLLRVCTPVVEICDTPCRMA